MARRTVCPPRPAQRNRRPFAMPLARGAAVGGPGGGPIVVGRGSVRCCLLPMARRSSWPKSRAWCRWPRTRCSSAAAASSSGLGGAGRRRGGWRSLHGMARLGKSSLAARIANRRRDLALAVVSERYGALSVLEALDRALRSHPGAAALLEFWRNEGGGRPEPAGAGAHRTAQRTLWPWRRGPSGAVGHRRPGAGAGG